MLTGSYRAVKGLLQGCYIGECYMNVTEVLQRGYNNKAVLQMYNRVSTKFCLFRIPKALSKKNVE